MQRYTLSESKSLDSKYSQVAEFILIVVLLSIADVGFLHILNRCGFMFLPYCELDMKYWPIFSMGVLQPHTNDFVARTLRRKG
jgi:hypothetical protein